MLESVFAGKVDALSANHSSLSLCVLPCACRLATASGHALLLANHRYNFDIGGLTHLTQMSIVVGNNLREDEWLEFESSSFPAYIRGHDSSLQPLGASPRKVYLNGFDGSTTMVAVEGIQETFGGRRRLNHHRRLTVGTVQWVEERQTVLIRVEGTPNCFGARPWDPCGGDGGSLHVDYAPPPSPPPPSPPLPPPPPPTPPPPPSPPLPPRGFSANVTVQMSIASLGSLTESALTASVEARILARLNANESATASFSTTPIVSASITITVTNGDATDTAVHASLVSALQGAACTQGAFTCVVTMISATAMGGGRRRLQSGTISFTITRTLTKPAATSGQVFATSSLFLRANATLAPLGEEIVSALPSAIGAALEGQASILSVGVFTVLYALGEDQSDLAASVSELSEEVAADLGVQSVEVDGAISVIHPPSPPPSPPPLPEPPPPPPEVPPGSPSQPPIGNWATRYTDGCNQTACPDGCFSSTWSNMWTWHGQGKALGAREDDALFVWPGFKSNVTIKKCRTVVLDIDSSVQLYSLVVWGTLRILDRGPSSLVSVRATCINIKTGGEILAGEATEPFSGVLDFLLSGDSLTESHQCGGRKGMEFDVNEGGKLKLYGSGPTGRIWGRMRATAEAGDMSATIIGSIDLRATDDVLIAGTDDESTGQEKKTVSRVDYLPSAHGGLDTKVTFTQALVYKHFAETETHGAHEADMRAEVSLYFRRPAAPAPPAWDMLDSLGIPIARQSMIRISGAKSTHPQFKFRTFAGPMAGMTLTIKTGAETVLHGVYMADGGKYGWSGKAKYMVYCYGKCDISNSVFVPRKGDGIFLGTSEIPNKKVENILMTEHFTGVRVGDNCSLLNSVFIGNMGTNNDASIESGTNCNVTVHGNALANTRIGFNFKGGNYCAKKDAYLDNTVHSCAFGVTLKANVKSNPTTQDGLVGRGIRIIWRARVGVWLYMEAPDGQDPIMSDMVVVDAEIGLVWSLWGHSPIDHTLSMKRVTVTNSAFVGRSYGNAACGSIVGIMLPISTSGISKRGRKLSIAPGVCGTLGGKHLNGITGIDRSIGSYPTLLAETRVTKTTFMRYIDECGGDKATLLETMQTGVQDSSDGVPPLFFRQITIDADSRANLANLKGPKVDWIVPTKCGVMDCDGPKQVIIHDVDGTLTGLGPDASILARSEFMHERRKDKSQFTWYNIPTKMLYDPAPMVRKLVSTPAPVLLTEVD